MLVRALRLSIALVLLVLGSTAGAQEREKAQIDIVNNRNEPIVMRFDYAFRQYTWNLIEHAIGAEDDITYRYPSNIPGCERLREWRITDGILTISNAKGPLCQKRISLCDKSLTRMTVSATSCDWTVQAN